MNTFKKTLLRSAALSAVALIGLAAAPAMAQSGCPNNSDFGNRGVCNESPAQNLPQQPAPDVAPQQQAPQAQPQRGGGEGRNRGNDRGGNNRNDNRGYGYDTRSYDNRGYDNRGFDGGYRRGYGRGGYSYEQQPYPAYPSYGAYPTYNYQQSYAAPPYNGGAMSEEQIEYVLQQQGFSRIETVDYATGQYTVDARDPSNRPMRLRVSAANGQILEAKYR